MKKVQFEDLSTIKKLQALKIPYSICIGTFRLKNTSETGGYDYFIVAPECHKSELQEKVNFPSKKVYAHYWLVEKTMQEVDIDEFKKTKNDYVIVNSSSGGRVYEVKGNSLKDYLKKSGYKKNDKKI
jgi:hypothetical protein